MSGLYLARLVKVLSDDIAAVSVVDRPPGTALSIKHIANFYSFFRFAVGIGVPQCYLFDVSDLLELKNFTRVCHCSIPLIYYYVLQVLLCIIAFACCASAKGISSARLEDCLSWEAWTEEQRLAAEQKLSMIDASHNAIYLIDKIRFDGSEQPERVPIPRESDVLLDPTLTCITGDGLSLSRAGMENVFEIVTFDTMGNRATRGGAIIHVDVTGSEQVRVKVEDNEDGT